LAFVLGLFSLCGGVTGIGGIICGVIGMGRSRTSGKGRGLAMAGIITSLFGILLSIGLFVGLVVYGIGATKEAALRLESAENLRQIGLGMQNFDKAEQSLPLGCICDRSGKPVLSWRVAILPYINEEALYKKFNLEEPWDGPTNRPLIAQMPRIYESPLLRNSGSGETHYKVFVGPGTIFQHKVTRKCKPDHPPPRNGNWSITVLHASPRKIEDILFVAEAGDPVTWSKPDDLTYDPSKPLPNLKGPFKNGFLALLGDGRVTWFANDTRQFDATLRAYIEPNSTSALKIEEPGR